MKRRINRIVFAAFLLSMLCVPVKSKAIGELDCGYVALFLSLNGEGHNIEWAALTEKVYKLTGKSEGLSLAELGLALQYYKISSSPYEISYSKLIEKSERFIAVVKGSTGERHFVYGESTEEKLIIYDLYEESGLIDPKKFQEIFLEYAIIID